MQHGHTYWLGIANVTSWALPRQSLRPRGKGWVQYISPEVMNADQLADIARRYGGGHRPCVPRRAQTGHRPRPSGHGPGPSFRHAALLCSDCWRLLFAVLQVLPAWSCVTCFLKQQTLSRFQLGFHWLGFMVLC